MSSFRRVTRGRWAVSRADGRRDVGPEHPHLGQVWPVPPQVEQVLPRWPRRWGQFTTPVPHFRQPLPLPDEPELNSPPPVLYAQSLP